MKKKTTFWIFIIVIVLIIIYLVKISISKPNEKERGKSGQNTQRKVDAFVVKPSLLINEITVTGSLLANDEVDLKNEVAGRIVGINLPEGKFVKKGTLLVKLFDDDLQANLKKSESQLAIQNQIAKRQAELLKVNGISQNDYDQTTLLLNSIKADIEVEKTLIRKTEVLAPFDGIIGLRNVSVGAIVTPSTLLATIRTANRLKLDFFVPEKYGSQIKNGMAIKFTLYNTDIQYDATVFATEKNIDNATRNLKVRAYVKSNSDKLIPGAFANVSLRLSENNNALMIPTQAIIPEEADKSIIVAQNGKAHFVKIKTGIRKVSKIEVTDGIQQGDTIITTGILFLNEGAKLSYSSVTE